MGDFIMSKMEINTKRLFKILNKLSTVPEEIRGSLPSILSSLHSVTTHQTDQYFLIVFLKDKEEERVIKFAKQGVNPFPGLVLPQERERPTAISLDNSRYFYLNGNKVTNLYSLKLGKDCTVVIQNHRQSIGTKEFGRIEYTIDLAYLISFGNEITIHNFYDYLDDLITFSLKTWRSA
jgi:hypothetical protein